MWSHGSEVLVVCPVTDILFVLLQDSIGVDQDIINISSNKYIQVLSENSVNK